MKKTTLFIALIFVLTLCLSLCACNGGDNNTGGSDGGSGGNGDLLEFSSSDDGTCYVKGIGNFKGTDLVIPSKTADGKTVVGIERGAFKGCTDLVSVTIPDSITEISFYGVFEGCTSLANIQVDSANTKFCSIDGILFDKDQTKLIRYPAGKTNSSYEIPDGVKYIEDYAFESCAALTDVDIPDSLTSISAHAFENCVGITSIYIPNNVSEVGEYAFDGCTSLTSIYVGSSSLRYSAKDGVLFNKKAGALYRCPVGKTGSYSIPSSVENITSGSFRGCTGIVDVTIPANVTNIGNEAFYGCTGITAINYRGTIEQWNAITKGSDWNTNMGAYTIYCSDGNISK